MSSLDWLVLQEEKLEVSAGQLHSVLHGNQVGLSPKAAPLGGSCLVSGAWFELWQWCL